MQIRIPRSKRLIRLAAVVLGLWVVLEILLLRLAAAQFGWGATVLALSLKSAGGLVLLFWLTIRGFRRLTLPSELRAGQRGAVDAAFVVASAILVALPGLLPAFFGAALFAPSLRAAILRRILGGQAAGSPRHIDLDAHEWRETRVRRPTRRRVPAKEADKPSLEPGPPSL